MNPLKIYDDKDAGFAHTNRSFLNHVCSCFCIYTDKPTAPKKGTDLFENEKEEDELFSSKPKTTKPVAPPAKAKPSSDLFGDSTEDDLFSTPTKPPLGKEITNLDKRYNISALNLVFNTERFNYAVVEITTLCGLYDTNLKLCILYSQLTLKRALLELVPNIPLGEASSS